MAEESYDSYLQEMLGMAKAMNLDLQEVTDESKLFWDCCESIDKVIEQIQTRENTVGIGNGSIIMFGALLTCVRVLSRGELHYAMDSLEFLGEKARQVIQEISTPSQLFEMMVAQGILNLEGDDNAVQHQEEG